MERVQIQVLGISASPVSQNAYALIMKENEGLYIPLPYAYSKFLFYSSFSMLLSAIIAIIMNDI